MNLLQRVVQLRPLPPRPAESHKGTFGRVLVIGGSADMIGAPAFAGMAAYRAGVGYVQLATPRVSLLHTLSLAPECIGLSLPSRKLADAIKKADAIAIGPGLGTGTSARTLLDAVLKSDTRVVIDADALNLLSAGRSWPKRERAQCVLTPHPGEMKRLGKLFGKPEQSSDDEADRIDTARRAAEVFGGSVIVLKGARTIVTDGRRLYVNHTGSPVLARAGSGDVLSGITAAFLAAVAHFDPFDAACTATWIHGTAGRIAGRIHGERSTLAREVCESIAGSLVEYQSQFG